MNQNKGIIGISLILAIVLGMVVVGGGAYYLGKNNSSKGVNNLDINKNLPVDNNKINTPSIAVISPNGGEQLVVGSKYDIKYQTNFAPTDAFVSLFIGLSGKDEWQKIDPGYPNSFSATSGSYEWTIPKEICGVEVCAPLISGEKYTLKAVLTGTINNEFKDISSDISDNSFTINSEISTANIKTYAGTDYGFSFNYPSSWKISEDKNKKEVTISTNDIAGGVDGRSYPSWSINFKSTDKTFFNNNRVSTKMGIITYDENLKALMSDSCLKSKQFFGSNPPDANNISSIQSIVYGGSLMSDPAYSNSAILTSNGEIIIVNSYQGVPITPELNSQLLAIINSFKLLNGNTVFIPACSK